MTARKNHLLSGLESEGGLMIDRVLEREQTPDPSPLALSNAVLAQRKAKIDELQKEAEEMVAEKTKVADEAEATDDTSDDFSDEGDDSSEGGEDSGNTPNEETPSFDDPSDEFTEEVEDTEGEGSEEGDDKPTTETFSTKRRNFTARVKPEWDIFGELKVAQESHRAYLRSFNTATESLQVVEEEVGQAQGQQVKDDTAIVYVKEPIVSALVKASEINRKYLINTDKFIATISQAVRERDEKISNFLNILETGKIDFTNKVVTDGSLLKNISFENSKDPRNAIKRMREYLKLSNDAGNMITNSRFDQMKDAFIATGFVDKGDVLEYGKELPGFTVARVSFPDYSNYVKTNITDYKYYTTREDNPNSMYNIQPVAINDVDMMKSYVKLLRELILEASVTVDILKAISINFGKLTDELRIMRVNVEEGAVENLSELGLDEKLQQFIVLKMVVEITTVNANIVLDFITSMVSLIEETVTFKDVVGEYKEENLPKADPEALPEGTGGSSSSSSSFSSDDDDDDGDSEGGDDFGVDFDFSF